MTSKKFPDHDERFDAEDVELSDAELYFGSSDTLVPGEIPMDVWDSLERGERRAIKRRYRRSQRRATYVQARDTFLSRDNLDDESRLSSLASFLEASTSRLVITALVAVVLVLLSVLLVLFFSHGVGPAGSGDEYIPVGALPVVGGQR